MKARRDLFSSFIRFVRTLKEPACKTEGLLGGWDKQILHQKKLAPSSGVGSDVTTPPIGVFLPKSV